MKIQLLSDLHLEYVDYLTQFDDLLGQLEPDDASKRVLVLAGDIIPLLDDGVPDRELKKREFFRWAEQTYRAVVYVPGNHEYYNCHSWNAAKDELNKLRSKKLHVLGNEFATIDGQRFFGGTLWYAPIRDHMLIPGLWGQHYTEHKNFRHHLRHDVQSTDIVVSHHLPSMACVAERYRLSPTNGYFVSELNGDISISRPKLWLHGHTHDSVDVRIGSTHVLCNPRGYPNERKDYDPFQCLIEV